VAQRFTAAISATCLCSGSQVVRTLISTTVWKLYQNKRISFGNATPTCNDWMAAVDNNGTAYAGIFSCILQSCEDFLPHWLALGCFLVCSRVDCGSSNRIRLALDRSRFPHEGLILAAQ
jgi:hypothetical protein